MRMKTATVQVQSAWASKVNWTQAIGLVATLLALATGNAVEIPGEQQAAMVAVIQGVTGIATWIIRTWFTRSVTPASLPK
jgi:hypothetical protein